MSVIAVVGHKCDLAGMEAVEADTVQRWAEGLEAIYYRTTARDYNTTLDLFEGVALAVLNKTSPLTKRTFTLTSPETLHKRSKRKKCC